MVTYPIRNVLTCCQVLFASCVLVADNEYVVTVRLSLPLSASPTHTMAMSSKRYHGASGQAQQVVAFNGWAAAVDMIAAQ